MKNALELKNVSKSFTGFEINDITFSLPEGCILGLVGKNGQDAILKLVKILIASNRLKDIDRIYEDETYREQLIKEYNISN